MDGVKVAGERVDVRARFLCASRQLPRLVGRRIQWGTEPRVRCKVAEQLF